MSTRTIIRDHIVAEFNVMKDTRSGRVPEFDISLRWLAETETKRSSTYCIIITDENMKLQTQQDDAYELMGAVVLWANDTTDARAKLDLMIEDAFAVLRRAFLALRGVIQSPAVQSVTTTEASTADDVWAQAVIRWMCIHQRAAMQ
jgi:hypothetical protein